MHHIPSRGQLSFLRVQRFPPGPRVGTSQGPRHARHGLGQMQRLGHFIDADGNTHFDIYCGADVGISASLPNASAATFQLATLKHVETCVDMTTDTKHFILYF